MSKPNKQSLEVTSGQEKSKEEIKAERRAKQEAQRAAKERAKEKKENKRDEKPVANVSSAASVSKEGSEKDSEGKSKAELKAERRAKQEAQRAAKELAKQQQQPKEPKDEKANTKKPPSVEKKHVEEKSKVQMAKSEGTNQDASKNTATQRKVTLFSHLPQYNGAVVATHNLPLANGPIHPWILRVGLMMSEGLLMGANSTCLGLMHALKQFISQHEAPENEEWLRHMNDAMDEQMAFLARCRSISVSMHNAVRHLKSKLQALDIQNSEDDNRQQLLETIDTFVEENIRLANKQICMTAREKMRDGDVILTFGYCPLVENVLKDAKSQGVEFRVIVADGRPKNEGREMCRRLTNDHIQCAYVTLIALPYCLHEVTRVFLGAEAVFANGSVMARVGTAQVSLLAKAYNLPVLVCCETYKFSERAQTDSFVFNELGNPEELVRTDDLSSSSVLSSWRSQSKLSLLNLSFDVTPPSLVDAIVSELCVIPTTSVPVVLRMKNAF